MKTAEEPFRFFTASYLIRIGNQKATNLDQLREGLEQSSDESIFYHTFQTLGLHHFLTEGFSNDFAQWVLAATNRVELAEQLAGLDIRDYLSLAELRADLQRVVAEYCESHPSESTQTAFEPFYFREGIEITVPLGREARTLAEFREGLANLGHASLQFHFITSRLRLQLRTNDFSHWLAVSLGLEGLARQANRIDIYTNTLDGIKERLLALVERELVA
jgi:Family of unknown function (DUF5752)